MQLLLILILLLSGGRQSPQNLLKEVRPVLENLGGEELREALKSAEEISEALSAVKSAMSEGGMSPAENIAVGHDLRAPSIVFPLAPVSRIADRDITYSLSRYFAEDAAEC